MLGIGIGPAFKLKAGSTYQGPLDLVSGASAAYSLRKLRSAYSGSAIRVRRSSDNSELDIGFTSAGDLDTAALLAHCGAGSGFVTKWYDQSGNGYDAAQTTAANQPRIVNSGVVDVKNGKPSLVFDGTADHLFHATPFMWAAGACSIHAVFSGPAQTNRNILCESSSISDNPLYRPLLSSTTSSGSRLVRFVRTDENITIVTNSVTTELVAFNDTLNQASVNDNGSLFNQYVNGAASASISYTRSGTLTLNKFSIGVMDLGGTLSGYFDGYLSEVITHTTALSTANRQTLEANQKSYYGTP